MTNRNFIDDVYKITEPEAMRRLYDEWSSSYDDEVKGHGYATPRRCAAALAGITDDLEAPVLDFGCGTGISGEALAEAGFTAIDGCDLSQNMLEVARSKNIYRDLRQNDVDSPVSFVPGTYLSIAAVGVISVGAAPAGVLDQLLNALPAGGTLTFSFNEHTVKVPEFENRVFEYVDTGAAQLLFKESGEHLPGIGLSSVVYVLQMK